MHAGGQHLAATAQSAAEYLQLVRSFKGLEAPVAGVYLHMQQGVWRELEMDLIDHRMKFVYRAWLQLCGFGYKDRSSCW